MTKALHKIYKKFPDEGCCVHILEKIMWNDLPTCPYCNSNNYSKLKDELRYHCNNCNTSYSVMVNSIFHKTKVPLQKWFYIMYLKEANKLDVSVRSLAQELAVTKDTANRIVNKINNFYFQNEYLFTSIYSIITKILTGPKNQDLA